MDDQKIHHLLQLKCHKRPTSEMLEEFILEFHRRQETQRSSASFFEEVKDRFAFFFSELPISRIAYIGATSVALYYCFLIFQNKISTPNSNDPTTSSLCSENFPAINYYSSPVIQRDQEEPVSYDLTNKENDSIFSSMSHLLQNKSSLKKSLISF